MSDSSKSPGVTATGTGVPVAAQLGPRLVAVEAAWVRALFELEVDAEG